MLKSTPVALSLPGIRPVARVAGLIFDQDANLRESSGYDHGELASCYCGIGAKIWTVVRSTRLARTSTWVACYDLASGQTLDEDVEGVAGGHVLERLATHCVLEVGGVGDYLGYQSLRSCAIGPEVWQVAGWQAWLVGRGAARVA